MADVAKAVTEEVQHVAKAVTEKAAFPVALLLLVVGFLVVQDRIDRRDPKLAQTQARESRDLGFGPPPAGRSRA